MTRQLGFCASILLSVLGPKQSGATPIPPSLESALAKGAVLHPVASWCTASLIPEQNIAFAVAVGPIEGAGQYLVIDGNGTVHVLADYSGAAEVSCYSRTEATRISETLKHSKAVEGAVEPLWPTGVVCGFVEDVRSQCWQFSAKKGKFVQVGEWST